MGWLSLQPPTASIRPPREANFAPDLEGHRYPCGIDGAIAEGNVVPILMEGLGRWEYRGYGSPASRC